MIGITIDYNHTNYTFIWMKNMVQYTRSHNNCANNNNDTHTKKTTHTQTHKQLNREWVEMWLRQNKWPNHLDKYVKSTIFSISSPMDNFLLLFRRFAIRTKINKTRSEMIWYSTNIGYVIFRLWNEFSTKYDKNMVSFVCSSFVYRSKEIWESLGEMNIFEWIRKL